MSDFSGNEVSKEELLVTVYQIVLYPNEILEQDM